MVGQIEISNFPRRAHQPARRSQVQKESWQHNPDCAPHHSINDGDVFLHMVPGIDQEFVGSQPGCGGQ